MLLASKFSVVRLRSFSHPSDYCDVIESKDIQNSLRLSAFTLLHNIAISIIGHQAPTLVTASFHASSKITPRHGNWADFKTL